MSVVVVYFVYGLAFIVMGLIISLMPKRSDFLGLSEDLWSVALFAFVHGANEWIELFIIKGTPFDIGVLNLLNSLSLPLSYIFLVIFGSNIICREKPKLYILRYSWIVCSLIWISAYFLSRDFLVSGIIARYFIGFPGLMMSAIAVFMCVKKIEKEKNIPKTVFYGALMVMIGFTLYGIFGGLIVPKAGFFPASYFNNKMFMEFFHFPVQLLRAILAMIMTIGFLLWLAYSTVEKIRCFFVEAYDAKPHLLYVPFHFV